MILPIVEYGHPVLRQRGALVDPEMDGLEELLNNMLETMDEANGIGLAAQQIDMAIQLTIIDVSDATERESAMWVDDEPVDIDDFMPLVLMNPKIEPLGEFESGQEGCLSFPDIYGEVSRPKSINVEALQPDGSTLSFRCEGLLSRAVQHETDHLNGILFIDRMDRASKDKIRAEIDTLHAETKLALSK
jgi:peptide deformylase